MPVRWTRASIVLVAVLAVLATACTAPGTTSSPDKRPSDEAPTRDGSASEIPPSQPGRDATLDWHDCDGGFQCAKLEVPVDHDAPDAATLELALVRRPARGPGERIGSLLINPGGPGASAIDFVENFPLPATISERFDIVGFDPRGVGRSTPLDCHSHLQEIYDVDPTFDDARDRDAFLAASEAFVDECEAKHGDLLAHLGTVDVARDMDRVREALGADQLSYIGFSYGTSIGQQYARLFPDRVRAMVLDGVVDPSETGLQAAEGQAEGFDRALDAFIADCDDAGCGLDDAAGDVIDEVIATAEDEPIPAPDADRPAGPGVVSLALAQALYSDTLWPRLADALDGAAAGDGDGLVDLADAYLRRDPDGTYPDGFEVYFAVSCLDAAWPSDPQAVFDDAKRVGAQYPRTGEALVNDYARCALWPVPPEPLPPVPTDLDGLAPVVVLSTTGDPATPYQSGVDVARRIPGAVLMTNEGEGHTIFGQGKACIDDPVTAYLVEGTTPRGGIRC